MSVSGDLGSSGAAAAPIYSTWGAGDEEFDEPQLQSRNNIQYVNNMDLRRFSYDRQFSVNSDVSSNSGGT